MEKHLIEVINLLNGKLYYTSKGSRFFLAFCDVRLDIYEEHMRVPTLGLGTTIRKRKYVVTICSDIKANKEIDFEFFKEVDRFDIVAEYFREDGIFKQVKLSNINPLDIEIGGEWVFEVKEVSM